MTKQEYADYQERVAFYLNGCEAVSTGPCPGCVECGIPEDAEEYSEEPHFSWHPCEICGSRFGGDRESWHCIINGKIVHGTCCEDCIYFINYGRLDDKTMQEIENESTETRKET
jgi:hypothetical protein